MVPTLEALTPVPTVGFPEARSGGQLVAQAPKHVLLGPESFLNRYTMRPRESTRRFPRLPLATSTVAVASPEVPGDLDEVVDAPPHAASATAASAATATTTGPMIRLVRVIFAPVRGGP